MITEVFAQFTSIFNSLLTIGIIARLVADNHIVDEINNVLLKSYYKKTAVKLLRNNSKKILENNKKTKQKGSLDITSAERSKKIKNLQDQINEANFSEEK